MNRDHSRVDDPNYFIGLWLYTNLIEYLGKYFTKLNITQVFHRRPLTASNDGKLLSLSRFSSWFHHWMGFLLWNIFVSGTEVYHSNWLRLKNKARLVGFYLQKKKKKTGRPTSSIYSGWPIRTFILALEALARAQRRWNQSRAPVKPAVGVIFTKRVSAGPPLTSTHRATWGDLLSKSPVPEIHIKAANVRGDRDTATA